MANVPVMSSETAAVDGDRKSRLAGLVLASMVVVVMLLLNLPYDYVEVEAISFGGMELDDRGVAYASSEMPRMAGWPVRFSIEYGESPQRESRHWSTIGLLANAFFAFCLAGAVYGFVRLRKQQTSSAPDQSKTGKLFDACIASAILIVPLLVVAWSYRTAYMHKRLATKLLRNTSAEMSCWVPKVIAGQVPSGLMRPFQRLRSVRIIGPDQQAIDRLVRVRSLVALHCFGGEFDSASIEQLADRPHFNSLQLFRRELTESDMDAIAKLRWLTVLNLASSNLDGKLLRRIDGMDRLQAVNLRGTPLKLSNIGKPKWSATVRQLRLTRPPVGVSDSLEIDGWPELRRLSATRTSVTLNRSAFNLRLVNLPELNQLFLDRVQMHSVTLRQVPRLPSIDEGGSLVEYLMGTDVAYPCQVWMNRLDIDGADSLTRIGCYVTDLKMMSIRNVPNLRRITLGSYFETSLGTLPPQPVDPVHRQGWLQMIGSLDGPAKVELFGLPMDGSDLSPLANNARIRHLGLGASGVSFDQIRDLEGMQQLESLDLGACPLEEDQLGWVLDKFPKLRELTVNGSSLARFDPTGRERLRTIRTSPLKQIQDIRIVDLPLLKTFIVTAQTPKQMEIRNAQSLRGLIIQAPWPKQCSISGLRDLDCFLGGGEAIDDEVMDAILECTKLDQLTLAYPSISRQKLCDVGQLYRLSVLAIPGADVDDEVTSHWNRLSSLWDLNLNDTSVSAATIAWASSIEPLRRLSLNRVELDREAIAALHHLRQVSELHLAGTSVAFHDLAPLLKIGNLEVLNLSGQQVDDQFITLLANASSLRHLILRDSDVSIEQLQQMLQNNPALYVETRPSDGELSEELIAQLSQRSQSVEQHFSSGWRNLIRMRSSTPWQYGRQPRDDESPELEPAAAADPPAVVGMIDRRIFLPHAVDGQALK